MGTASYMAPEQAGGPGDVGPWSDVYAMGAIVYEMLSGIPAYGGTTVTEVLAHVMRSEHPPLGTRREGLPDAVYALVERCMSREPIKRPQDADAMRIAVAEARLVPLGTPIVGWRGGATGALVTAGTPTPNTPASPTPNTPGIAPTIGDDGKPLPGRTGASPTANAESKLEPPTKPPVVAHEPPRSSRRWLMLVAAMVVVGIVIAILAMSGSKSPGGDSSGGGSNLATKPSDAAAVAIEIDAAVAADAAAIAIEIDAAAIDAPAQVARAIDAGHAIDASHPIDAAPKTADCSAADELVARARQLAGDDNWKAALPVALQAATCRPGNPNMHRIITIAACMAGNDTLAAEHFNHVINQRPNVREICKQHHVALP
jgi:hypothetical protein